MTTGGKEIEERSIKVDKIWTVNVAKSICALKPLTEYMSVSDMSVMTIHTEKV